MRLLHININGKTIKTLGGTISNYCLFPFVFHGLLFKGFLLFLLFSSAQMPPPSGVPPGRLAPRPPSVGLHVRHWSPVHDFHEVLHQTYSLMWRGGSRILSAHQSWVLDILLSNCYILSASSFLLASLLIPLLGHPAQVGLHVRNMYFVYPCFSPT